MGARGTSWGVVRDFSESGFLRASEQKRRWRLRLLLGNQEADRVSGTVSLSPQATDGFGG